MPEPKQPEHDPDYPNPQNDPRWTFIMTLFGSGTLCFLILVWMCSYISDPSTYWQVFVGGAVSLSILFAMFVQARISQQQWQAMRAGLEETRKLVRQGNVVVGSAQRQAIAAEKSLELSKSIYFEAQKAYLKVRTMELQQISPTQIVLTTTIQNSGNTPAWEVEPKFRLGLGKFPMTETEQPIPEAHPEQVISEVAAHETPIIRGQPIDLSPKELADILLKEKALIISVFLNFRCIRDYHEEVVSHHLYDPDKQVFIYRKAWPTGFKIKWGGEWFEDSQDKAPKQQSDNENPN